MAKIEVTPITSGYNVAALNETLQNIEDEFKNKVVYRDEVSPMERPLDMNGERLINVSNAQRGTDAATLDQVQALLSAASGDVVSTLTEEIEAAAGQTLFTLNSGSYFPGADNIRVYINGLLQNAVEAYVETSPTSITFTEPLKLGDVVHLVTNILEPVASVDPLIREQLATASGASTVGFQPAGGVARTVENRLRESVSVKDFGAVGDGVTDDTAAINAALDYLRSLPTGGGGTTNQDFRAIELVFPPAKYRCNGSLNFTNIRTVRAFIRMSGSMILSYAEGKTAVDFLHSGNCIVEGLTIWGASTSVPLQGLQIGRRQFDETAPNMLFIGLTVLGHFSRASMYNYGSENLRMEHPRLLNARVDSTARSLISVGNTDEFAPVSDFQTLGTLGPCSFLDNLWTRLDARKFVTGSAVTLSRTSGHKFIKAYAISFDDAPWEIVNDGFGHLSLDIDAHIETHPVPYGFRFRSTTGLSDTCIMRNFRWEENNSQAGSALFYADSSVTRVLFIDADVTVTGVNTIPTNGVFFPTSRFRYWGKLSLLGVDALTGLNIDQFDGELFVHNKSAITPPTGGTFVVLDRQITPATSYGPRTEKGVVTHETPEVWPTGVFTPTLTFATPGDLSVAYTVQTGNYVKVGRMVLFQMRLSCTPTFTTAAGELRISGLPFTALAGANTQSSFSVSEIGGGFTWPASRTSVAAQGVASASYLILRGIGSAVAPTTFTIDHAPSGTVKQLIIAGVYYSNT